MTTSVLDLCPCYSRWLTDDLRLLHRYVTAAHQPADSVMGVRIHNQGTSGTSTPQTQCNGIMSGIRRTNTWKTKACTFSVFSSILRSTCRPSSASGGEMPFLEQAHNTRQSIMQSLQSELYIRKLRRLAIEKTILML